MSNKFLGFLATAGRDIVHVGEKAPKVAVTIGKLLADGVSMEPAVKTQVVNVMQAGEAVTVRQGRRNARAARCERRGDPGSRREARCSGRPTIDNAKQLNLWDQQPVNAEAIIALVSLALGTLAWLFRQSSSVSKALVELGICKADVQKLQAETQTLRDQSVRQDTLVQTVMTQLAKLDKVDALVSSVDVMRAVVERLGRRVDQRQGND
jgi:hypothetical protein